MVTFFIKNKTFFENKEARTGIYSGDMRLAELVVADTDKDGIPDWEEAIWGTDPTLSDTDTDGIPDLDEIARLKEDRRQELAKEGVTEIPENSLSLTQTDKFSRELFSTVVALSQAGEIDQATSDQLAEALNEQIKNSPQRKVYEITELRIIPDNSKTAVEKYIRELDTINKKYPVEGDAISILNEFIADGETEKTEALLKLDPAVKQKSASIAELVKMSVPSDLAETHLKMINALQGLVENLSDIGLFEVDPLVAMGATSKFEINSTLLGETLGELGVLVNKKLNNQ